MKFFFPFLFLQLAFLVGLYSVLADHYEIVWAIIVFGTLGVGVGAYNYARTGTVFRDERDR